MKKLLICGFVNFLLIHANANDYSKVRFDNLNSGFIENRGQVKDQRGNTNEDVKFLYSCKLFNLQLKERGFSYELFRITKTPRKYPEYQSGPNDDDAGSFETMISTN